MDPRATRTAKWLIGIHAFIAWNVIITRTASSDDGSDFFAGLCAALLTTAAFVVSRGVPGVATSARRLGGLVALGALAAFVVHVGGPALAKAEPFVTAREPEISRRMAQAMYIVPFAAAFGWSMLSAVVASPRSKRFVRPIAIATGIVLLVSSIAVLARTPRTRVSVYDWIDSRRVVARIPRVPSPDLRETTDRFPVDHDLWLVRLCSWKFRGFDRRTPCRLVMTHDPRELPDLSENEIGRSSPRQLSAESSLLVRWLPGPNVWFVEARSVSDGFAGAIAFDGVDLRPVVVDTRMMRGVAGPTWWVWLVVCVGPFAAFAAWWLARGRRDSTLGESLVEGAKGRPGEPSTTPSALPDAVLAELRRLPTGPVVFELEANRPQHFREPHSHEVKRVVPGTLEQWKQEAVCAALVPWVAAAVAGYCALSALAAWVA